MALEKLPSVIENADCNDHGFVISDKRLLVPAYVASDFGFHHYGRIILNQFIYPELEKRGVYVLCPFKACSEYLDFSILEKAETKEEVDDFHDRFNRLIGPINYETLMPCSKFLVAILEGHTVDEGVAAEITHFVQNFGHVIGVRTDFRLAENPRAPINPAVRHFLDYGPYDASFIHGPFAYEKGYEHIGSLVKDMLKKE